MIVQHIMEPNQQQLETLITFLQQFGDLNGNRTNGQCDAVFEEIKSAFTYRWHMEVLTNNHEMIANFRWNGLIEFFGQFTALWIEPCLLHYAPSIVEILNTAILRNFQL